VRVLAACSLGGAGHLQPLVPFLDAARLRGDETLVVGPPALADLVARTEHPFHPGGEPPESQVAPIRERLPVVPPSEATVLGNCDLFGRLATSAMLRPVEELCAVWKPDLLLRDPCEYASAVVAEARAIPHATVAISLADAEWGSIEAASPALEVHRAGLAATLRASHYVTRFPASVDPSPFTATTRYRDVELGRGEPLPDWWSGSAAPMVYVSFGTVLPHMTMAAEVYRDALASLHHLPVRLLLTVGHRFDPQDLGTTAANVHVEPWVDQARVTAEAAAVVCHGGSGTTLGALRAGVPLVVVPMFADQFENARRVEATGVGVVVDRSHLDGLHSAVQQVLDDERYRAAARRISAEMRDAPAVDEVLERLGDEGRT
jgi:hypothetical protein